MKRRLLSLIICLCMIVVLLPSAGAAEDEDFTKYLTSQMITDEDITFGGIPVCDLTYEKAKEILSSMELEYPTEFNDHLYPERFLLSLELDWDSTGPDDPFKGKIDVQQSSSDSSLKVVYSGGISPYYTEPDFRLMKIETPIRGISTGDTLEEALKKLGISEEGSKVISNRVISTKEDFGFGKDYAQFYDREKSEIGLPVIVWKSDLYHLQLNVLDGHILSVMASVQEISDSDLQQEESDITEEEYIYDVPDPGEDIVLPVWRLEEVVDKDCTVKAIDTLLQSVSSEQLKTPTGIDLATLYAETALLRAACKEVKGGDILINAEAVKILESVAVNANAALEEKLKKVGIPTARKIANTVTFMTNETKVNIRIDPDILKTKIDKVRVETPAYALTFKLVDLEADLTGVLTFRAEQVGAGYKPSKVAKNPSQKTVVKVDLPKGKMSNPVTVSLPKESGETTYQAVVSTEGTATASKYNPASDLMDGKVNTSGSYTVKAEEKDFTDIANKSAEMQKAIRYLASKGIINGTTETAFSPDGSINRAEIATLIVKALGKLDSSAIANFTDVARGSWYYSAAASSQKQGYIQGYEDQTFRGPTAISKIQIVSVAGRVLTKEMGYKTPASPASLLTKYSDSIAQWAQPDVALATQENLVVSRKDGSFSGEKSMTRGDAAILIYRLFQRIW